MDAYVVVLALHNIMRWVVVVAAIWVIYLVYSGLMQRRSWKATEGQAVRIFTISMDVQLLLGLILYFVLSPITGIALQNFGAAMRDSTLRYFAVEHLLMMVLAVVAVHVGAVMIRRRRDDRSKYVQGAIWMTIAILLILVGIPWQRPLLPFVG
jgi:hypothetical protein